MRDRVTVEVCVESADGALIADKAGADSIELCSALVEGGVTPSFGSIATVMRRCSCHLVVLLRPRGGDFLYSPVELDCIERDLLQAKALGASGVAVGFLHPDATIDRDGTSRALELAAPMKVTFNRAFDLTRDPREALATLIELGVHRVLTSGHAANVTHGLDTLADLVYQASEHIEVVPAGGVTEENIAHVIEVSRARAVHFSGSAHIPSPTTWRNDARPLAPGHACDPYEVRTTDSVRVESMIRAVR